MSLIKRADVKSLLAFAMRQVSQWHEGPMLEQLIEVHQQLAEAISTVGEEIVELERYAHLPKERS